VGTTSFNDLIKLFLSPVIHAYIRDFGAKRIVLQIGRGESLEELELSLRGRLLSDERLLPTEVFRFSSSIESFMQNAILIISHAGAGSIMEALALRRPLIVVVNQTLMDNHQLELSSALEKKGYLLSTDCSELHLAIKKMSSLSLEPYPPKTPQAFADLVDQTMGF
jgi:beta-1,4-N-acetylglucosaminyltransferase